MARARWRLRWALILVVATTITLAAYYPVVAHPNSTVLQGPNDESSSARDLWAAHYEGKNPFTFVNDRLLPASPGGPASPAVQIANGLQPLFVEAVRPVSGDLGAFNVFMLVGLVASLVAMFALLGSLGMHPLAAAAGAIAFASSPMSVEQLLYGHIGFAQLWIFPLVLGSLLWARHGRAVRAVAPGLAYALSFYTFAYLGLLCSLVVLTFGLALVWQRRSLRPDLRRIGIGIGAAAVGLLPGALATRIAPTSRIGLPHFDVDQLYGAHIVDFFLPSSRHVLYGRLVHGIAGVHVGDAVEFFGYATLALACVGVVMVARRRVALTLPLRFAILLVPLAWFAALPAEETIFGTRVPLPDPARVIGSLTSWWRVYERFGAAAGFGLVILAAAGLDRLVRSGRRLYVLVACAAALVMVFEALPGLPAPTYRIHVDGVTRWLAAHQGGAVTTYPTEPKGSPTTWSDTYWLSYYLQKYHRHPLFDEPDGQPEGTTRSVAGWLAKDLSSPTTPGLLRAAGVRWVVLRRGLYSALGEHQPRLPQGLAVAASFPGAQILRVTAPPTDMAALLRRKGKALARTIAVGQANTTFEKGFYGSETFGPYHDAHWLEQNGKVAVRLPDGITVPFVVYEVRLSAFSTQTTHTVQMFEGSRRIATFTVPTSDVVVDKLVRFPASTSTFTFKVSPAPTQLSPTDARLASVYFLYLTVRPVGLKLSP